MLNGISPSSGGKLASLPTTVVVTLVLINHAAITSSQCNEVYNIDGLEAHDAHISTIMHNDILSWPTADVTARDMRYTVTFNMLPPDNYPGWCDDKHCVNLTTNTCDLSDVDYYEYDMNFQLRVIGRQHGSNRTLYFTGTVVYNSWRNLTLITPSFELEKNTIQKKVVIYPMMEGNSSSVLEKLQKLKFQVQYWRGNNETGETRYMEEVTRKSHEHVMTTAMLWMCARVRLHLSEREGIELNISSPWSEVKCTEGPDPDESPEEFSQSHWKILIPCLVTIGFVVLIVTSITMRRMWASTCKGFTEKSPLPESIAKIVFHQDDLSPDSHNDNPVKCATEVFVPFDMRYEEKSASGSMNEYYHESNNFPDDNLLECPNEPLFHTQFNMTYGFGCLTPHDLDHDIFTDDHQGLDPTVHHIPYANRLYPHRCYLSSTSTTSTELSPTGFEYRSVSVRSEDGRESVAADDRERQQPGAMSNLYFNDVIVKDQISEFDRFNPAYSSNPTREVPDLLYEDKTSGE